eukprot:TRINITY_DN2228_c0_g1_i1.p1 TRINITY_DN2228_c0_g1~~TRINITY_DN2228_c0_g1_i1.p1  ORF type:complete len:161 (-),score=17.41 TRINITY_DN2228_c0_g1_i1:14-496(-)
MTGMKNPVVCQSMYIFKPPKIGAEVPPHQDSSFLRTEPLSCIAFWFPVDDATLENGCLWAIPGSHKVPLKTVFKKSPENTVYFDPLNSEVEWPDHDQYVPVPVNKGDVVILHGNVIHKSFANTSANSRHAYTFHVVDGDCEWNEENWLQRTTPFAPLVGQ